MRLLVISQSLVQRAAQARWRRMAAAHPDLQVRLLVPRRWVSQDCGPEKVFEGRPEQDGNFEVRTVALTSESNTSIYLVRGLARELRTFAPHVIFPVHCNYQLAQTVVWRRVFARRARLLFFTMGVHAHPSRLTFRPRPKQMLFEIVNWFVWQLTKHGTDAAMCHNADIERCMREDGYRPPVLVQTQIGVDEEVFHPEAAGRAAARAELGLDGFVLGFAGRITVAKGILDIASAMPLLPPDVRLLVVGDGPDRAALEQMAVTAGWRDRLRLTGYVPLNEVARYMRAMDCFVLGSRTTATWTDTFPLVVAQAMATGLPVVGSDSGAIPFQLGAKGMVFHEGDVAGLANLVRRLRDDAELRHQMGRALLARARAEFCIGGMNGRLYALIESLAQNQSVRSGQAN